MTGSADKPVRTNPLLQVLWSLRYFYSIAVLLLLWESVTRLELVDSFLLPSLSSIVVTGYKELVSGAIFVHLSETAYRTVTSLVYASIIGVAIGASMRTFPVARWFGEPLVSALFPIPKIAFMPVFVLWFGVFDTSKIVMTVFASVVPIISATYLGSRNIDEHLFWSAQSMGTSKRAMIPKVVIPAALPSIFSGIQIATPLCLIVSVVTEMMTGGRGLGSYMIFATRFAESDKVFFGIFVTTAFGILLIESIRQLRKFLLPWHEETLHGSE